VSFCHNGHLALRKYIGAWNAVDEYVYRGADFDEASLSPLVHNGYTPGGGPSPTAASPLFGGANGLNGASNRLGDDDDEEGSCVPRALVMVASFFDVYGGLLEFFEVKRRKAEFDTDFFEGLRTISMLFVIYGHTLFFPQQYLGFDNPVNAYQFITTYGSIGIFPAELAVDVFFFMSGFLFLHLYINHCEKLRKKEQERLDQPNVDAVITKVGDGTHTHVPLRMLPPAEVLLMYVHRYLRIAPVVAVVLFFASYVLPFLPGDSPFSPFLGDSFFFTSCRNAGGWWHNLLFVQNFRADWAACVGWFWYLSCDFQLFVFAPIIAALRFVGRGIPFYVVIVLGVAVSVAGSAWRLPLLDQEYYNNTLIRCAPYLYGMLFASLLRVARIRSWLDRVGVRTACYLVGAALMISCINLAWYMQRAGIENALTQYSAASDSPKVAEYRHAARDMESFNRFVSAWLPLTWGIGLGLFTVCWASGHGGALPRRFLSNSIFVVVSKLTYTMYMLHPLVMGVHIFSQHALPSFTPSWLYVTFCGYAVFAFLCALVLYLTVEVPFAKINNALTKRSLPWASKKK